MFRSWLVSRKKINEIWCAWKHISIISDEGPIFDHKPHNNNKFGMQRKKGDKFSPIGLISNRIYLKAQIILREQQSSFRLDLSIIIYQDICILKRVIYELYEIKVKFVERIIIVYYYFYNNNKYHLYLISNFFRFQDEYLSFINFQRFF